MGIIIELQADHHRHQLKAEASSTSISSYIIVLQ